MATLGYSALVPTSPCYARKRRRQPGRGEGTVRTVPGGNRSLNILIIANVQWPRFGIVAGGTAHALEVARIFADEHTVRVVVPAFIEPDARRDYPDLQFIVTPVPRVFAGSTIATQCIAFFNWIARRREMAGADAIIAASHFLGDVLPLLFLRNSAAVVIVHHLVEPPWRRKGNPLANALHFVAERLALLVTRWRADAVLTDSRIVEAQIRRFGIRQKTFLTVNAPHETPYAAGRNGNTNSVLFVGRLAPTKGIEALLSAWTNVLRAEPEAELWIAGGGGEGYSRKLRAMADKLGLGRSVTFLGRVSEPVKSKLFNEANVFAFPSVEEGFGISIAEAMLAGLPCVTYDLPIFDELFPVGRCAARRGNPADLARCIITLLRDEGLRRELADSGRRFCRRYSWANAARCDLAAVDYVVTERTNDAREESRRAAQKRTGT